MSNSIYFDLSIGASLENVFEAISEPEHLINWWPLKCSGIPEVGNEYNFFFTPEYDWLGEVVRCDGSKSFYIKMKKADEDWSPTTFGFDLELVKDRVKLKFSHIDWPSINDHFRRSSFCWAMLLNGLKNYLEKGMIIPFEERE